MKFKEYLIEMIPSAEFSDNWIIDDVNGYYTYIHIDLNNKFIVTNVKVLQSAKHSFTVLLKEDLDVDNKSIFYFKFKDSNNQITKTNLLGPLSIKLFAAIEKIFETMVDKVSEDTYIGFCSSLSEPSRIKLYDTLIKRIGKKYTTYDNNFIQKLIPRPSDKMYGFYKNIKKKTPTNPEQTISKFNFKK